MSKENFISRFAHFVFRKITPEDSNTFEKRLFLIATLFTSLFAIPMLLINLDPNYPIMHTVAIINFGVVNFIFFALARWAKKYMVFLFVLMSVLNTGFIWFFNQGVEGSLNFYFLACFMYSIILMRNKKRFLSIALNSVIVSIFFAIEYLFPEIIDELFQYQTYNDKILDLYAGMVSVFAIILISMNSIVKNYDIERNISAEKIKELSIMSVTDRLTNLFNRGYLNDKLLEYATSTKTTSFYFSVFMVDVDHFKSVNDKYGHTMGDEVLKTVSNIIKNAIRKSDTAGRYGGEEFMVILPLTHIEDAMITAGKIRMELENTVYPILPELKTTASFGVAEYTNGESITNFVNRADACLYEAKHSGRNRVIGNISNYFPPLEKTVDWERKRK